MWATSSSVVVVFELFLWLRRMLSMLLQPHVIFVKIISDISVAVKCTLAIVDFVIVVFVLLETEYILTTRCDILKVKFDPDS